MINQNEIEEAARFFPNKQRAREDFLEQQCQDFNSGDRITDAVAFIMGHCVGQQYMSEEKKKLEDRIEKLREALLKIGYASNNDVSHGFSSADAINYVVQARDALALDDQLKEGKV